MKIMTWNVGMFTWYKYYSRVGLKLNGYKVENEYFQKQYSEFVCQTILQEDPEVCFLQEFFTDGDRLVVTSFLKKEYPYSQSVSTWYHEHSILIFSKEEIVLKHVDATEFFIVSASNQTFIPIHLNSFSASKRLAQVEQLIFITKNNRVDYILGDTNFWAYKNHFLYSADREAYKLLQRQYDDTGLSISSTSKAFLNFDRIFFTKGATTNASSPKIAEKGMDHYPVLLDI